MLAALILSTNLLGNKLHLQNMHKISTLFLTLVFTPHFSFAQQIQTVEVAKAYNNRAQVNLSSLAESIEYIQLETSEETLLRYPNVKGIQGDSMILVKSSMRISLFDRKTGAFLNDVGHRGNDPDGFALPGQLGFDPVSGNIFASRYMFEFIEYSSKTNQVVKSIPAPDFIGAGEFAAVAPSGQKHLRGINSYHWMYEGYVVGYVQNLGGKERLKLIIYNRDGKVVKYFNNGRSFTKDPNQGIKGYIVDFHDYNKQSYFKEWFSDTLYSFNSQKMRPLFYFNTEKYRPIYEKQDLISDEQRRDLMFVKITTQDINNLYFQVYHKDMYQIGLFNKKTNQTFIAKQEKNDLLGFHNDIDNFVPFAPKFTTPEGNVVGIITAEEMLNWLSENKLKADNLPERLKKFRNIDPEDNPIVMIVKPKK